MISAVSIYVIPEGETRRIKTYSVFVVTMFWSIFAYFWLLVILGISSKVDIIIIIIFIIVIIILNKDRVEIWEAASTLAFIPLVIITSWMAERGWLDWAFPGAKVRIIIIVIDIIIIIIIIIIISVNVSRRGDQLKYLPCVGA